MKKKLLLVFMVVLVMMLGMGCFEWFYYAAQDFDEHLYYYGNGHTSGLVPGDINDYDDGDSAIVLGNIGNLEKDGYTFSFWNTNKDGSGTTYQPGQVFTIHRNLENELFAKWEK